MRRFFRSAFAEIDERRASVSKSDQHVPTADEIPGEWMGWSVEHCGFDSRPTSLWQIAQLLRARGVIMGSADEWDTSAAQERIDSSKVWKNETATDSMGAIREWQQHQSRQQVWTFQKAQDRSCLNCQRSRDEQGRGPRCSA
jgi:hypothetical protein